MSFNLNENSYFFNLKIPLRYLQPPNYSHVAGPAKKVKSVRKERGGRPGAEPRLAPSSTVPVAIPTSPMSPPQHPMDALHLCWGRGIPVHGATSPPKLLAMTTPGGQHPSVFPPSSCPSFFVLPSPPSPFPLSFPSPDRSSPAVPVGLETGAAPAHYPILRPPRPRCCRIGLFAVCGVPSLLPCTPTYPLQQRNTPPSPCNALMAQGATQPPRVHTLQYTVHLGVQFPPPPPRCPSDALRDLGYNAIPLHDSGYSAALPPPAMPWTTQGAMQSPPPPTPSYVLHDLGYNTPPA